VIYLRNQLLLPLDDLLAVVREFIEPAMSHSALDRCLRTGTLEITGSTQARQ